MNIISRSESDTAKLAADLARAIEDKARTHPVMIMLSGDLGMGKSVFARAFIRNLCQNNNMDVPSPTYTLVQQYDTDKYTIRHFDLYRVEDPEEIYEIGWEDAIAEGITLVEWPERLDYLGINNALNINITTHNDEKRIIHITAENEATAGILNALRQRVADND